MFLSFFIYSNIVFMSLERQYCKFIPQTSNKYHQQNFQLCLASINNLEKYKSLFPKINDVFSNYSQTYYVGSHSNANIKAFSIIIFKIILKEKRYQSFRQQQKQKKSLVNIFKKLLYRPSTILTRIKNVPQLKQRQKICFNLNTPEIKKLIGQFLKEILVSKEEVNILEIWFLKYPFIQILMSIFIRSLLWFQFDNNSSLNYNESINDIDLFMGMGSLFQIQNIHFKQNLINIDDFVIGSYNLPIFNQQKNNKKDHKVNVYFMKEKIFSDSQLWTARKKSSKKKQYCQRDQRKENSLLMKIEKDQRKENSLLMKIEKDQRKENSFLMKIEKSVSFEFEANQNQSLPSLNFNQNKR